MGRLAFNKAEPIELKLVEAEVVAKEPASDNPLDSEKAQKRLKVLENWLQVERERQAPNRYQMALDEDFYDGLQWNEDDAAELAARGQAPLVYNKVMPAVRWITGTEKRTRIDFRVYPRGEEDRKPAEAKTKLLKYLSDVNKSQFARSRAFEDAVKVGVGWLECGIRGDPTEELLYDRYESWRNMLYDSFGSERDQSDWRYMIRMKTLDLDVAQMMCPDRAERLRSASTFEDFARDADSNEEFYLGVPLSDRMVNMPVLRGTTVDASLGSYGRRERVKVYEMWYRYPMRVPMVVAPGHALNGKEFDPRNDMMRMALAQQAVSLQQRTFMAMRCALFIKGCFLQDVRSPYRHNRFPFTPVWGNRRGRDNLPYGAIRNMRDPQEDLNKRMSKALHAGSTKRIIMDAGAVEDVEVARAEAARPDAVLVKKKGYELKVELDAETAQFHLEYAKLDAMMMQDASGVTDENMGKKSNATSGIALERRQEQGSVVTADYFDNLRLGVQLHGEKELSLCEQYMDAPKTIRILGDRSGFDMMEINRPNEDGSIENPITASEADFVVSAQDFRETIRQAMFEQLLDMVMKIAQVNVDVALKLLDDVLEFSDIPGREDVIATVREITGKAPKDQELTPEQRQALAAQKQKQQQVNALLQDAKIKGVMLELAEKEAQIAKLKADAAKSLAQARQQDPNDELRQQYEQQFSKLQDDTAKLVDALRQQVQAAQLKLSQNTTETRSKERVALYEACLEAVTKVVAQSIATMGAPTKSADGTQKPSKLTLADVKDAIELVKTSSDELLKFEVPALAATLAPAPEPVAAPAPRAAPIQFEYHPDGRIKSASNGRRSYQFETDQHGRIKRASPQ